MGALCAIPDFAWLVSGRILSSRDTDLVTGSDQTVKILSRVVATSLLDAASGSFVPVV